ncbi:MAG: dTDP-4-dehydrorhamnose 3,5-epimerase [Minisyncoccia bacterium]|jgi:dTDP-4-dehydrorhamnose 3,5-epimerase
MIFQKTKLDGVWVVKLEPRVDERGFFVRNFAKEEFAKNGIDYNIVHINRSLSKIKGTTRGLHYQQAPKAEDKMLQCLRGRIYWVVVDLRKNSKTYGQWVSVELTPEKMNMVICPKGCANGIQTLEDDCELQYFVTEYYSPEHERGLRWNDPYFGITWPLATPAVISEKDSNWPLVEKENLPTVTL